MVSNHELIVFRVFVNCYHLRYLLFDHSVDKRDESDDSDMRTLRETMANILATKDHDSKFL